MTFAVLRALHAILGDALDDIERVYAQHAPPHSPRTPSPTPTPSPATPLLVFTDALVTSVDSPDIQSSLLSNISGLPRVSGLGSPVALERESKLGIRFHEKRRAAEGPNTPPQSPKDIHIPSTLSPFTKNRTSTRSGPDIPTTPKAAQKPSPPLLRSSTIPTLDFPSLPAAYDPSSPAEQLTTDPTVVAAINRIVAAAGQLSASVQAPFLSLCDASMGYNLPACLRFLEATHIPELLRATGPEGMHVAEIAHKIDVDSGRCAHILRLLATHHIINESAPDKFALNRISAYMDTGKPWRECVQSPAAKYEGTNGIAAFVGLCTDELFKSSAYLTEAYYLHPQTRRSRDPGCAPFAFAFLAGEAGADRSRNSGGDGEGFEAERRDKGKNVGGVAGGGYFGWLEDKGEPSTPPMPPTPTTPSTRTHPTPISPGPPLPPGSAPGPTKGLLADPDTRAGVRGGCVGNRYRLERFGKAMTGNMAWEAPGAVLNGFDWAGLPPGSTVVDVGGGIGSTSMVLANEFEHLRFVIQDRGVVVEMGVKAWRDRCPELLNSGRVDFQVHDFFTAQPIRDASVFFLRVILHDWPDAFAQKILLRLREVAREPTSRSKATLDSADAIEATGNGDDAGHDRARERDLDQGTRLVLADWVLPLACADDFKSGGDGLEGVEGAQSTLAPAPLLANLGKASANAYWMDLTMQVIFNGQERTLREIVALAASAGWKVIKVTRAPGSLFGHIIAVPTVVPVPVQRRARAGSGSAFFDAVVPDARTSLGVGTEDEANVRASAGESTSGSRCGTPKFGSRMDLPSFEDAFARFGGRARGQGVPRGMGMGMGPTWRGGGRAGVRPPPLKPTTLKPSALISGGQKSPRPIMTRKPSRLTLTLSPSSSSSSLRGVASPPPTPSLPSPMSPKFRLSAAPISPTTSRGSTPISPTINEPLRNSSTFPQPASRMSPTLGIHKAKSPSFSSSRPSSRVQQLRPLSPPFSAQPPLLPPKPLLPGTHQSPSSPTITRRKSQPQLGSSFGSHRPTTPSSPVSRRKLVPALPSVPPIPPVPTSPVVRRPPTPGPMKRRPSYAPPPPSPITRRASQPLRQRAGSAVGHGFGGDAAGGDAAGGVAMRSFVVGGFGEGIITEAGINDSDIDRQGAYRGSGSGVGGVPAAAASIARGSPWTSPR